MSNQFKVLLFLGFMIGYTELSSIDRQSKEQVKLLQSIDERLEAANCLQPEPQGSEIPKRDRRIAL